MGLSPGLCCSEALLACTIIVDATGLGAVCVRSVCRRRAMHTLACRHPSSATPATPSTGAGQHISSIQQAPGSSPPTMVLAAIMPMCQCTLRSGLARGLWVEQPGPLTPAHR
jgi:hypothetical protein